MRRSEQVLVWMRNAIVEELSSAVDWYENYGGKEHIRFALSRLMATEGYSVDMRCTESFSNYGKVYNHEHIKIVEADEGFTIRIYPIGVGNLIMEYNEDMLLTREENERVKQYEAEAESNPYINIHQHDHIPIF